MEFIKIKFCSELSKNTYENGKLLAYQTAGSSGFDIRAVSVLNTKGENLSLDSNFTLNPGERVCIQVGIAISIPQGYEVQIRPRSGLAFKNGITIVNTPGTIDSDYRGEIGAILLNTSSEPFHIERGMRIAQAVISKVEHLTIEFTDDLDSTERGDGRFGSTGKK